MSDPPKPNKARQYAGRRPEAIEYRNYRLAPQPLAGGGWKVFIYPPGDVVAIDKIPSTENLGGRETVIQEAKLIVDRHSIGRR